MFLNTDCQKIISYVPEYNSKAYALAKRKMTLEGKLTKAFLKDGKLHDLFVFGLRKEEVI
jgi:RimJ/RimL family protein N-acetyltransferase